MTKKKLKLPIIKENLKEDAVPSMEEYLEFIMFNLKYTVNKKEYRKWKKISAVNVPFRIK
ncbi:hypothetical protein ACFL1T_04815 [Chlamydiota bacterium]